MATITAVGSVYYSSDFVKVYVCDACTSKNFEESADYFCASCKKFFCRKCIYQHDQLFANHSKYGREETNQWPLTKTLENLLLKCDIHKEKKLETFCHDHSQLCCSDCVLLDHRQCVNVIRICDSVKKMPLDMQQLPINLQTILEQLNKFKCRKEASMKSVDVSWSEKLQEIRDLRNTLNAALDALEKTTLKELDEIRTTLQTILKNDVDNCSRLIDELKQLSEAIHVLCDKSEKEIEFIASRKCLDKIQESKAFLKEITVKLQSSMIFKANIDIEKYLSQQASLGRIVDSMQSLTLKTNPNHVMTVKRISEYIVRISSDPNQTCSIRGVCCLPDGQVICADCDNSKVKLLDQNYNVVSHCDVSDSPTDICQITTSEVAVIVDKGVQFIAASNGQLVNGRKFQLPYAAYGIAHHQGALYITSGTALYHHSLNGSLVKKLFEDTSRSYTVFKCAVSPDGDRIYVTSNKIHKLITLATNGILISTFMDPELQNPWGVHVTPSGQVLVCGGGSNIVMQIDCGGRKKLATFASQKDGLNKPVSVCYNSNIHNIVVGLHGGNKVIVLKLQ
ncbi:uncharacterized protein LOC127837752 [Dreissena polymorpha]|uniref:uncharacterized protein LOC127837752 n=1 Tax=Dreissena polymorpha TaxID=45954 RepID=UPI002264A0A5|nr:uncharacterized protein LOC127837752 [Dreissena polymorpha]